MQQSFGAGPAVVLLAMAQVLPVSAQVDSAAVDVIQVIGSRAEARSVIDAAVPVDVFSADDLRATGAVGNELGEALAILAPGFAFPRQSNSVTSDHVRSAQLRGMSPDQVLVLVNGKRRHPSAVVNDNTKIGRGTNAFDFNTIPISSVKRIEILRDGASAQYGSDAIAGVINIVLDDSPTGGEFGASYGAHRTDVGPTGNTETDGNTATAWFSQGLALGEGGFLRFGVEGLRRGATNRAGFDNVSPFIPQTEANLAFRGQITHRSGDPETEAVNLWLNSTRPLGEAELYGVATVAWRETDGAAVFRHPDTNQNVREVFPQGFLPETRGENLDFAVNGGIRHSWQGWELDHSLGLGRNRFEFGVVNSLNPSLGPVSPTSFDSGTFRFDQLNFNHEARRAFDVAGWHGPLNIAAGFDYRFEQFESFAGDPASFIAGDFRFDPDFEALVGLPDIGSQGAKGLSPDDEANETRNVVGIWLDASVDLTERLLANAAVRFEHYNDFGSTWTGKLAARYRVSDAVNLRASASNSFRAPSLSQIGWSRRDNTFSNEGARISSRLVRQDSAIARALGLPELDEETSLNFTFGATAQLAEGLSVTLDAFHIAVDDRITLSEFITDPAVIEQVQALPGGQGVQALSFFTNAVDTETYGAEAVLEYRRELAGGNWTTRASYIYVKNRLDGRSAAPAALAALNPELQLVGIEEENTIETAVPRDQGVLDSQWQRDRLRLLARARYFGAVERVFTFAEQRFDAEWAFDAEAGWRVLPNWEITAGANNLFDNLPDASANANNFFGNFAFDPIVPIGINGRFLYLRSVLNW
ncbi:MAG: TonB-dependent receptor [Wenzhouxiangellaceae bacterium]|nr:TonB-dependent receptor [Wenzhouxiangellaceae bacterium]